MLYFRKNWKRKVLGFDWWILELLYTEHMFLIFYYLMQMHNILENFVNIKRSVKVSIESLNWSSCEIPIQNFSILSIALHQDSNFNYNKFNYFVSKYMLLWSNFLLMRKKKSSFNFFVVEVLILESIWYYNGVILLCGKTLLLDRQVCCSQP